MLESTLETGPTAVAGPVTGGEEGEAWPTEVAGPVTDWTVAGWSGALAGVTSRGSN